MSGHFFNLRRRLTGNWPRPATAGGLDEARTFLDDDEVLWTMGKSKIMRRNALGAAMLLGFGLSVMDCVAQDKGAQPAPSEGTASAPAVKKLTIEVSGGEKNVAVENASVYLKYAEERKLRKDKKYALNVKTNRDGTAHIPDPPLGKVLIQVVAEGWKTFGEYYDLGDAAAVIKIHLDRPKKWY
jgi:hypothetical protein